MTVRDLTSAELQAKVDAITAKVLLKQQSRGLAPKAPQQAVPVETDLVSPDLESWWLPEPVGAWVDACAAAFGVPKSMPIAAALCAACAMLQGKVQVEIREGWREPLSLYWLVFSGTGTRKSALLKLAAQPIRAMQQQLAAELEPVIRSATRERARLEVLLKKEIHKAKPTGEESTDEGQQARERRRRLHRELDECVIPKVPRWLFDDIMPTVVPRKLKHNQEAEGIARLAVLDAEGTFLANLLGRHSGTVNVDPLLKGYAGEPIDMVRTVHGQEATADTHLDAAHLSLLLLVQPHILDDLRSKPELGSNGFLGRCLMTHVADRQERMPWNAPSVPPEVQEAYGRWLATLAAIEPGTVWQVPAWCHIELAQFHDRLETDRLEGKGAAGWNARTLGRICRILAITELGIHSVNQREARSGAEGVARVRVLSKLTYLINSLYYEGLEQARLVEPARPTLPTLSRRALTWLRAVKLRAVGEYVTLSYVRAGLRLGRDNANALCDSLVESGHFEQGKETRAGNKRLTVEYKILSLDPEPTEHLPPVLIDIAPPPAEPEPYDGPEPDEYLGNPNEPEPEQYKP